MSSLIARGGFVFENTGSPGLRHQENLGTVETRRELSARMDRIDAIALETRSGLRAVKDPLDKIEWEREPIQ